MERVDAARMRVEPIEERRLFAVVVKRLELRRIQEPILRMPLIDRKLPTLPLPTAQSSSPSSDS